MRVEPSDEAPKGALAGFTPLFGCAKIVLAETPKAVTPFGGLGSFIAYLQQIGFGLRVAQMLPFPAPTSPNAIPLAHTFTAFFFAVVTGASRFAPPTGCAATAPCTRCWGSHVSLATIRCGRFSAGSRKGTSRPFGGRSGYGRSGGGRSPW